MWCAAFPLRARVNILRLWDLFGSQFDPDGNYKEYEMLRRQNETDIASTGETLTHRERQEIAAAQVGARTTVARVKEKRDDLDAFLGVSGKI